MNPRLNLEEIHTAVSLLRNKMDSVAKKCYTNQTSTGEFFNEALILRTAEFLLKEMTPTKHVLVEDELEPSLLLREQVWRRLRAEFERQPFSNSKDWVWCEDDLLMSENPKQDIEALGLAAAAFGVLELAGSRLPKTEDLQPEIERAVTATRNFKNIWKPSFLAVPSACENQDIDIPKVDMDHLKDLYVQAQEAMSRAIKCAEKAIMLDRGGKCESIAFAAAIDAAVGATVAAQISQEIEMTTSHIISTLRPLLGMKDVWNTLDMWVGQVVLKVQEAKSSLIEMMRRHYFSDE